MISNRIKLARQANCLSLQQLADKMSELSVPVTKGTLSNYETGRTPLPPSLLPVLCSILGAPEDFFYQNEWEDFRLTIATRLPSLPSSRMTELTSYVQINLERYVHVSSLLQYPLLISSYPAVEVQANPLSIQKACQQIRKNWDIGAFAIPSVCNLLEQHGWFLTSLPDSFGHICFSGMEHSHQIPFLFYTPIPFIDEFRVVLLKELGRAFLRYNLEEEDTVLSCFAREMLLPADIVYQQFGTNRTAISDEELGQTKQKYGIARHEIMLHLRELGIISQSYYNSFLTYFNQNIFMLRENQFSSPSGFYEVPSLYSGLVARAMAEDLLPKKGVGHLKF